MPELQSEPPSSTSSVTTTVTTATTTVSSPSVAPPAPPRPRPGPASMTQKEAVAPKVVVEEEEPCIQFSGHHAYLVNIAQCCRSNGFYTDVNIQCKGGDIKAHRLVLASCSSFLRDVFLSLPQGLPEFTLIIPNIEKEIVETLIQFLYTGEMHLARSNTSDLQHLVHVLKIDPENVRIDSPDQSKQTRLVQQSNNQPQQPGKQTSRKEEEGKAMPARAAKRRASASTEGNSAAAAAPGEAKTPKVIPITPASIQQQQSLLRSPPTSSSTPRGGGLRRRGRARNTPSASSKPPPNSAAAASSSSPSVGLHDLSNVETWVCAICHQYDPVLPKGVDPTKACNTEWVGCDCDRWYHQYCTKLETVDDTFSCKQVKLKCLTE